MTIATDLALPGGPRRRLFLAIDGLEPLLWEDGEAAPAAYTLGGVARSGVSCLRTPGEEQSIGSLDLGEMKISAGGLSFELVDFPDPSDTATWYLAKLFAPGRWSTAAVAYLEQRTDGAPLTYLDANAATIYTQDTSSLPAAGTVHIGQETCSYTGKGLGPTLTGVVKGLYPCVGSNWGMTYREPDPSDDDVMIASHPFTWVNRRCALYVTTLDEDMGTWKDGALLCWVGRIAEGITWSPKKAAWVLSSRSILDDLDRKLGVGMGSAKVRGINLLGPYGLSFVVSIQKTNGDLVGTSSDVSITPAWYATQQDVADEVARAINAATWSPGAPSVYFIANLAGGIAACNTTGDDVYVSFLPPKTVPPEAYWEANLKGWPAPPPCHPLAVLGVPNGPGILVPDDAVHFTELCPSGDLCTAYHPVSWQCNGLSLYLDATDDFIEDQGDNGVNPLAWVMLRGIVYSTVPACPAAYSAIPNYGLDPRLTLIPAESVQQPLAAAVASRGDEALPEVKQCWIPSRIPMVPTSFGGYISGGKPKGPFELLLFPLLSTGTTGYSAAAPSYDVLPLALSAAMQADLVDVQSFLDADALVMTAYPDLAARRRYVIEEPVTFAELLHRECVLFGFFLCWDTVKGQLSLKSAFSRDLQAWTVTLSESTGATPEMASDVVSSPQTVVNCYEIEASWDYTTRKYWDLITVEDVNSIAGIQDTRTVKLKHPGIRTDAATPPLRQLLRAVMAGRSEKALPWWTTSASLASWLFRRIAVGDIVRFTSTTIPDPYGSGERACDCLGIVIDLTWNYRARSGRASLLLYSRFNADSVAPWAASALVDKSAANGGWDAANRRLTLLPLAFGQVGDQDDGARFAAGDYVYLIERAAADSTAPTVLGGPVQVDKAYEADGANLLTLDPATVFAAWDADKEWIVVPADYDEVAGTQKTTNAFQADATTRLIDGDPPHRWG